MNTWGNSAFLRSGNQVCSTSLPTSRITSLCLSRDMSSKHRGVSGRTIAPDRSAFLSTSDVDFLIQRSPLPASAPEFSSVKPLQKMKDKRVQAGRCFLQFFFTQVLEKVPDQLLK
jgi:hypothetical protein